MDLKYRKDNNNVLEIDARQRTVACVLSITSSSDFIYSHSE